MGRHAGARGAPSGTRQGLSGRGWSESWLKLGRSLRVWWGGSLPGMSRPASLSADGRAPVMRLQSLRDGSPPQGPTIHEPAGGGVRAGALPTDASASDLHVALGDLTAVLHVVAERLAGQGGGDEGGGRGRGRPGGLLVGDARSEEQPARQPWCCENGKWRQAKHVNAGRSGCENAGLDGSSAKLQQPPAESGKESERTTERGSGAQCVAEPTNAPTLDGGAAGRLWPAGPQ